MKSDSLSKIDVLCQQLADPEADYRALPFWSWNDKLDPDELRRQIHLMKQSGVGGYFMHARSGLKTDYLSPDWFDCIRTGIEAGDAEGLQPWVYDEEGWPSGFAGGKVNARGGWTYARGLRLRFLDDPAEAVQDDTLLGVYPLPQGSAAPYAECTQSACPYYIDILNEEVVRVFLETTHEEYARRFVLDNTAGLRGFFTDEPRLSEGPIPWSPILPDEFKARYGYDILPVLPALYLPYGDYRAVRHDFWALVNELFVHAYMEQIFNWCETHHCRLTGHMMMEESLYAQMTGTGGVMPFYEYMHQPGVDSLRRAINDPRIPKQVGSVAEQLGKPHVLSESFAMTGWDMRFNEMQWIAGWQFVNGVNRICQHLQGYTLAGMRKRDYPPSLFYQQSWYGEYHRFNDSLARLGKLLSTGHKIVDVLLIHPMHSAWVSYDGTNNDELQHLDAQFVRACELLGGAHIDYHLGDETLLARHGSLNADGTLQVGKCRYTAVVVPDCLTLDRKTVELLAGFAAAGHPLVKLGRWPQLCAGRADEAVTALGAQAVAADNIPSLRKILVPVLKAPVSIAESGAEAADIACCTIDTAAVVRALYLVNLNKNDGHSLCITLPGQMRVSRLPMDTLSPAPLPCVQTDSTTQCNLDILPMENVVLLVERGECSEQPDTAANVIPVGSDGWHVREADGNLLTLDSCEYRLDGGDWQGPKNILHLMKELLALQRPCDVALRYRFTCGDLSACKRLALVMEQPDLFQMELNGEPLNFVDEGYYKDIAFRKCDIHAHLCAGENVLTLTTRFFQRQKVYDVLFGKNVYETELNKLTYDMELEALYLMGDFGVYSDTPFTNGPNGSLHTDGPFTLGAPTADLRPGCLTVQGYPFFAGKIVLEKTLVCSENAAGATLDFGQPHVGMMQVQVNGRVTHTFLWPPYRTAMEGLHPGENTLTVTLYASNRNMLGPHHHSKGEPFSVGPSSWTGEFSWVERESEAVVITPDMRKQNFWQNGWNFVPFGLS
jgi:hypothetical protein